MERFEGTVPPTYFRNARAVIIVYAIDNRDSIDNIPHWAESMSIQRLGNMSMELIKVLVGNKLDLDKEGSGGRAVSKQRGFDTADVCDIDKDMVFEVSAMTGEGVDAMFNTLARKLIQQGVSQTKSPLPQETGRGCSC